MRILYSFAVLGLLSCFDPRNDPCAGTVFPVAATAFTLVDSTTGSSLIDVNRVYESD